MILRLTKRKRQSKWRIQRKEEGSEENKNFYKKKFSHSTNLKLMCELAKTPRFVTTPKRKQFEPKIMKHKETQLVKMKKKNTRKSHCESSSHETK